MLTSQPPRSCFWWQTSSDLLRSVFFFVVDVRKHKRKDIVDHRCVRASARKKVFTSGSSQQQKRISFCLRGAVEVVFFFPNLNTQAIFSHFVSRSLSLATRRVSSDTFLRASCVAVVPACNRDRKWILNCCRNHRQKGGRIARGSPKCWLVCHHSESERVLFDF